MKNTKNKKKGFILLLIKRLENYDISILNYLLIFLSISFIRNFLEGAMEISRTVGTGANQATTILQMGVLFNLEWMALFCALALVIHSFTKIEPRQLLKLMLYFFALIIVVPFIDLAAYYPSGCKIDYLYTIAGYMKALVFFFVPFVDVNVCLGIRLEVFAAFFMCLAYVYLKTGNAPKSLAAALLLYFLAVSSMAYPVFILLPAFPFVPQFDEFVNRFFFGDSYGGEFLRRNSAMIFILLAPLLILLHRAHLGAVRSVALLKSVFNPASLALTAAFTCGFMLAPARAELALFSNPYDIFMLISGMLTCLTYGLYLKDTDGLKPLYITLVLITSMALSFGFFLFFILLFALQVLYGNSPFKLDSYGIFRHVFIPLNALVLFLAGASLITGDTIYGRIGFIMPACIFFILVMVSLAAAKPKNSAILLLLFVSFVSAAPAAATLTVLIPAVICGGVSLYVLKKAESEEQRHGHLLAVTALLVFITAFLGR